MHIVCFLTQILPQWKTALYSNSTFIWIWRKKTKQQSWCSLLTFVESTPQLFWNAEFCVSPVHHNSDWSASKAYLHVKFLEIILYFWIFVLFGFFSHDDGDYDEDDNDNKDDEANVPKMLWLRNLVEKCWMLFGGGDSFCSIYLILDPKKTYVAFF